MRAQQVEGSGGVDGAEMQAMGGAERSSSGLRSLEIRVAPACTCWHHDNNPSCPVKPLECSKVWGACVSRPAGARAKQKISVVRPPIQRPVEFLRNYSHPLPNY